MSSPFDYISKLISQGRNVEARNLAGIALKSTSDLRLSQLFAMATSKSGAPKTALEHLEPLYKQHPEDPETSGILGGIYKEMFRKNQDTRYAILSRDTYSNNFIATKNYYTGINAATMSAIAGQSGRSREIAGEIINQLEKSAREFWEIATLGEAYLLSKSREKAIEYYFQARKLAGTDWGKINSVYSQLWLLNHYVPVPAEILKVFSPPGVVAFVGHMIDRPGRERPRFPESIEHQVKERIASALKTMGARIGLCSVACGSDILFAEAMVEAGGEVNIWLPFAKEDFIEASLRFAGQSWIDRFEKLTSQFPVTYITQDAYGGHDDLFGFQSRVIMGAAIIRSSMNHTKPTLLTVLSGTDLQRKEGGTRDAIMLWPFPDRCVNIDPDNFTNHPAVQSQANPPQIGSPSIDRPLLYFVCADLPGLSEGEQSMIWKPILEKMKSQVLQPVTFEITDILIASFKTINGAVDLARDILKISAGLRKASSLRISLYANPGFLEKGVGEQKKLAAISVNRLRRFHSLIPAGSLYALARFAACLALEVNKYNPDYAGVILPEGESVPFEIYQIQTI